MRIYLCFIIFVCTSYYSYGFSPFLPPQIFGLQSIQRLSANTPLQSLCPRGMHPSLCLSLSSQILIRNAQLNRQAQMFSFFMMNSSPMTNRQAQNIINLSDKWKKMASSAQSIISRSGKRKGVSSSAQKKKHTAILYVEESSAIIFKKDEPPTQGTLVLVPTEDIEASSGDKPRYKVNKDTQVAIPILDSKKTCVDTSDSKTEGFSFCTDCIQNKSISALSSFRDTLNNKMTKSICVPGAFEDFQKNFNNGCYNIRFEEFQKQAACEACAAGIPPALLLSIMFTESSGRCEAFTGDGVGLFQIHTNSSDKQAQCSSGSPNDLPSSSCLKNPHTNLREGIRILRNKYKYVNKTNPPALQCPHKTSILKSDLNGWKKATAAYNGGQVRVYRLTKLIQKKPEYISSEIWKGMDEWEKIRLMYFDCQNLKADNKARCQDKDVFKHSINNLAYTESIFGSDASLSSMLKGVEASIPPVDKCPVGLM